MSRIYIFKKIIAVSGARHASPVPPSDAHICPDGSPLIQAKRGRLGPSPLSQQQLGVSVPELTLSKSAFKALHQPLKAEVDGDQLAFCGSPTDQFVEPSQDAIKIAKNLRKFFDECGLKPQDSFSKISDLASVCDQMLNTDYSRTLGLLSDPKTWKDMPSIYPVIATLVIWLKGIISDIDKSIDIHTLHHAMIARNPLIPDVINEKNWQDRVWNTQWIIENQETILQLCLFQRVELEEKKITESDLSDPTLVKRWIDLGLEWPIIFRLEALMFVNPVDLKSRGVDNWRIDFSNRDDRYVKLIPIITDWLQTKGEATDYSVSVWSKFIQALLTNLPIFPLQSQGYVTFMTVIGIPISTAIDWIIARTKGGADTGILEANEVVCQMLEECHRQGSGGGKRIGEGPENRIQTPEFWRDLSERLISRIGADVEKEIAVDRLKTAEKMRQFNGVIRGDLARGSWVREWCPNDDILALQLFRREC